MKYIKFSKYLIRNDLESALVFYDYFLFRPLSGNNFVKYILRFSDPFIKSFLHFLFALRLNNCLTKNDSEKNFVIFRKNKRGLYGEPDIYLKKNSNRLVLVKEYKDGKILDKEIKFLSTYKDKTSKILFPQFSRINDVEAEVEFLRLKTLASQLCSGEISKAQLFVIFHEMSKALDALYIGYSDKKCLIHGDLSPTNVFAADNAFYVIDYADCHVYEKNFDKFNFLKTLLFFYYGKDRYDILKKYFPKDFERYMEHWSKLKKIKVDKNEGKF